MLRKVLVSIAAVALLLTIVGCQSTTPTTPTTPTAPTTPLELRIATIFGINTLNPYMTTSDGDNYIIRQVMEPLVAGEMGDPRPQFATSWEIVDELTWEFRLRDNAFWHEGNAVFPVGASVQVTAEDVKAAFEWVLDPANRAVFGETFRSEIKEVEVVDRLTVRFHTHTPLAWFLTTVQRLPIFPIKAIEMLGVDGFGDFPIGSGPFKFVELRPDDRVILERNESYYIRPNLDRIVWLIIPDAAVSAIALQTGEIDIALQIPPTEVELVARNANIQIVPITRGWLRFAAIKVDHPILGDLRVRQAITKAVDMDATVEAIFTTPGLAARSYVPVVPGIPGYRDDFRDLWSYDVEGAKALLGEAGWVAGPDGILVKDGQRLSLTIKTAPDRERAQLGIIMATELRRIGIDAQAQSLEWATLIDDSNRGNFDILVSGGWGGEDGLVQMFHTNGGASRTGFSNAEVDGLLDQARVTLDVTERTRLMETVARIVIEERVYFPAYRQYIQVGVGTHVVGLETTTMTLPLTTDRWNVSVRR